MSARTYKQPSQEEVEKRRLVGINPETVSNVVSTDFPGHYPGEDHSWNIDSFKQLSLTSPKNLNVNFHKNDQYDSVFSLVGIDASVANAYRRIMLSEIPTLAIEDVFVYDNTSIIQDEVLCHRLGLIPFTGSREGLRWMQWFKKGPPKDDPAQQHIFQQSGETIDPSASVPRDNNTIVLELNVTCEWRQEGKELARQGERDPNKLYINSSVYAHQFQFHPQGNQSEYFSGPDAIRPVNPDILIAKLRPGQTIHLQCHCIKGIGADHAKFSPVATASYRLLPSITIKEPILGADAKKFARCFPRGVIALEDDQASGEKKAVVANPMKDTVSRECLRHDEFKDKVVLGRIRDHFIFSVESTGQIDSDEVFLESVRTLKAKCERFKRNLNDLMR
ncbi:DNA-directed RNA polymerases I and III 40 kDa polypeptide [Aureobasidium subglaciale]|nr:DNA-directed RNA polymerases I and III 40 kDa polypeptide [Aureobasidium subglaciale]KAI5219355.1 DNA-directed RNA polymerases I and III 40 kDa polypeptide [Aureobasidium subglaciale]KAI5223026.1 DNA-directed RNA polymerases I and III 40 kDa polypeptide [Aureobasidium subglaciale]KAI5260322.1 DNA-directed RNA polymerases I and III 40 kDa polypeptide [Aureobasidium subglaciale]